MTNVIQVNSDKYVAHLWFIRCPVYSASQNPEKSKKSVNPGNSADLERKVEITLLRWASGLYSNIHRLRRTPNFSLDLQDLVFFLHAYFNVLKQKVQEKKRCDILSKQIE